MFASSLEQISKIYDNMDSILITNRDGIIEYCALFDITDKSMKNEGYTGKRLLEVYPSLTKETSTHFQVMKTGRPIIGQIQTVTDYNGKTITFSSSTYPIELEGEIIGAVEGTIMLSSDGSPYSGRIRSQEKTIEKEDKLYLLDDLITQDSQMLEVKEQVLRIAKGDSPVMIIGDTGTGKEVIAQAIHSHSYRVKSPFVSQNCSAIPMGLLESTLFGTVRGSYTGAENRKGLFELADKGTLFLDELNSMDIDLQSKILTAVEEQKIRRVGEEAQRKIDVRIVSAVNREPAEMIEENRMRRDLYYRLGVVQIHLPLLRHRKKDIPLLTRHYIEFFNQRREESIKGCSELAEQMLLNYSWPGNIRELKNIIEQAFNMVKGDMITIRELPETLLHEKKQTQTQNREWRQLLQDGNSIMDITEAFEKNIIDEILNESVNITEAAKQLGLSRQALNYKLNKYKLK